MKIEHHVSRGVSHGCGRSVILLQSHAQPFERSAAERRQDRPVRTENDCRVACGRRFGFHALTSTLRLADGGWEWTEESLKKASISGVVLFVHKWHGYESDLHGKDNNVSI